MSNELELKNLDKLPLTFKASSLASVFLKNAGLREKEKEGRRELVMWKYPFGLFLFCLAGTTS